jgi:hypothetical protein
VACGVYGDVVEYPRRRARHRVYLRDAVYLVAEELYPYRLVVGIHREDLHRVAAHAEHVAVKGDVVALVAYLDELFQKLVPLALLARAQGYHHARVVDGVAQAVDAGHGRDDDDVSPLRQARSRRVAQALYLVVYGAVLLDVGVRRGYIGLWLVVVVVGNEVFHGVVREKFAELRAQLGRQGLVVGQHQGRALYALYDLGHGVGLARARNAQQGLLRKAVFYALRQRVYRLRLVARGYIAADNVKIRHIVSFSLAEILDILPHAPHI